jgi:uncharacterized membrane protein
MKNKHVGIMLLGVSALIGIIVFIFNRALTQVVNTSCSHGNSCPMHGSLNFHTSIGILIILIVALIGLYLVLFSEKKNSEKKEKPKTNYKNLSDEEKKILAELEAEEGSCFQSSLVEKTDYSKVKVTRILDKLEGKKLIERKRRGMTNIVLLK